MKQLARTMALVTSIVLFAGCTTHVWLTEHRIWPEKPSFKIIPSTNIAEYTNSGIDFDAVYVDASVSGKGYFYYRFWRNGRVLHRSTVNRPTMQDVESFTNADVGFFSVKDNVVFIELFLPAGSPPWACGYELVKSRLEKDAIVDLSSSFDGCRPKDLQKYNLRYVKQPMPGMKRQPDW